MAALRRACDFADDSSFVPAAPGIEVVGRVVLIVVGHVFVVVRVDVALHRGASQHKESEQKETNNELHFNNTGFDEVATFKEPFDLLYRQLRIS